MSSGGQSTNEESTSSRRRNRWFFGGLSASTAVLVTHPLDLLKVQLQTQTEPKKTLIQVIRDIYANAGFPGFYNGVSASVARQMVYANARFGIYESGKQYVDLNSWSQGISLAAFAGFWGGLFGVPFDIVNVRMQNDVKLPPAEQRKYKHILDGLIRITREEGITTLTSGCHVAILRGVIVTISQNLAYDKLKEALIHRLGMEDRTPTYFLASAIAGGLITITTQPLDVVKTRLMNAARSENATLGSVAMGIARESGVAGFFKGSVPSFCRVGPQTILTFLIMEQLRIRFGYLPDKS